MISSMKRLLLAAVGLAVCLGVARAAPVIGQPAPDFTLRDIDGKIHSLADYRGKTVVLEWVNPECPFVIKHYGSQNIPNLQKSATADGVIWLAINSAHPGAE